MGRYRLQYLAASPECGEKVREISLRSQMNYMSVSDLNVSFSRFESHISVFLKERPMVPRDGR